ncbi:MAG: hypothetical protein F6K16_16000 [Symploca sp. SIO2B6]|nr:hypothetical protein [Symploca sp. SIO2B6]
MGRWGDGEMGRWGDGEKNFTYPVNNYEIPRSYSKLYTPYSVSTSSLY